MPFNGSGVFTRAYNWVQDKSAGRKIMDTRFDAEMNGMAVGLSNVLLKNGTQRATAKIPFARGIRLLASDIANPASGDFWGTAAGFKFKAGNPGRGIIGGELISSGALSVAAATYSLGTIPTGFRRLRLLLTNIQPADVGFGTTLGLQFGISGGAVATTNYMSVYRGHDEANAGAGTGTASTESIRFLPGQDHTTTWSKGWAIIDIENPDVTTRRKIVRFKSALYSRSLDWTFLFGGGTYNGGNGALTSMQINSSNPGNITSLAYRIYGWR